MNSRYSFFICLNQFKRYFLISLLILHRCPHYYLYFSTFPIHLLTHANFYNTHFLFILSFPISTYLIMNIFVKMTLEFFGVKRDDDEFFANRVIFVPICLDCSWNTKIWATKHKETIK